MTKIIGLTGGIGSGKTTIANYLKLLNIPVFIADEEAKKLMQSKEVISEIRDVFGDVVFDDTNLNRAKLAKIVFSDTEKLDLLNAIIHPIVRKQFQNWLLNQKASPFVVYESAILFESGNYEIFDVIITVTAPLEVRIERVIQRDKTFRGEVMSRIERQWSDEQKIAKSDFVIENINPDEAKEEINRILEILKK